MWNKRIQRAQCFATSPEGVGGGVLPYKRLIQGICRWMGWHFHDWSDYNGAAFSTDLLQWGRKFSGFGVSRDENGTILG